jgi:hypothetical protein
MEATPNAIWRLFGQRAVVGLLTLVLNSNLIKLAESCRSPPGHLFEGEI